MGQQIVSCPCSCNTQHLADLVLHAYRVAAPENTFSSCICSSLSCFNLLPALLHNTWLAAHWAALFIELGSWRCCSPCMQQS